MTLPTQVQYFPPPDELAPYVSVFAFATIETQEDIFHVDIFPIGYSVMSFALDDLIHDFLDDNKTLPRFNLTGQLTRYHKQPIKPGYYHILTAVLKPCAAYRLFNFPQSRLVDGFIDVADMLNTDLSHLYDEFYRHRTTPAALVQVYQNWLIQRLALPVNFERLNAVHTACDMIDASSGTKTIKEICESTGLSKSTLERSFLEIVGLTPKMYSRIIRFNKVYHVLQNGQFDDWQEVVYKYNFYDQAHFIKDFKQFFNKTPSEVHTSRFNSAELLGSAG